MSNPNTPWPMPSNLGQPSYRTRRQERYAEEDAAAREEDIAVEQAADPHHKPAKSTQHKG